MKFSEFREWCNERWSDGCWGVSEATTCISIGMEIARMPFWKREKEWQKVAPEICENIVKPINRMIEERMRNEI